MGACLKDKALVQCLAKSCLCEAERIMTHQFSKQIFSSQWRMFLLSALLVFVQFATVVHSEIHPFHEHSELCDVFYGVEHQSSDAPVALSYFLSKPIGFYWQVPLFISSVQQTETAYSSRAPPIS